jgi:hypothetical protein
MPSPDLILSWATTVANEWRELAIGWHAALALLALGLLAGWRPSNRFLALLLATPVASVSILAWISGNGFNAALFAALAVALVALAARLPEGRARTSTPGVVATGVLLVLVGWLYPHFVRVTSPLEYGYASPFGLLPCPTLAVVTGMSLVFATLQSRKWGGLIAVAGMLYGVIGVVALDVALDYFLFGGAVVLALNLVVTSTRSVRPTAEERRQELPGDELITSPLGAFDHAITIHAPRADVWPWLAQMGAGSRAGWYSYDWLDNGRQPSGRRIVAALQHLSVGMLFPAVPRASDGFTLLAYDPPRYLLLGWLSPDSEPLVTWVFVPQQIDERTTRLVVRARGGAGYRFHGVPWAIAKHVIRAEHFVMQRKQLLGIAARAEAPANAGIAEGRAA